MRGTGRGEGQGRALACISRGRGALLWGGGAGGRGWPSTHVIRLLLTVGGNSLHACSSLRQSTIDCSNSSCISSGATPGAPLKSQASLPFDPSPSPPLSPLSPSPPPSLPSSLSPLSPSPPSHLECTR